MGPTYKKNILRGGYPEAANSLGRHEKGKWDCITDQGMDGHDISTLDYLVRGLLCCFLSDSQIIKVHTAREENGNENS